MSIIVNQLSRFYLDHTGRQECVFNKLSFSAKPGEQTLVMGSSGSGKSTLLNLLALIDPVQEGSIEYFGEPVHQLSERQRAARRASDIGFIFQNFALIEEFSVRDNCALPLVMNNMAWQQARHQATELLEQLVPGVNPNKYPRELSGGQQQRIAIARALINKPRIIIADEPTGNLDDVNAERVRNMLKQITHEHQVITIIVSHDPSFTKTADRHYRFEPSATGKCISDLVLTSEHSCNQ